MVRVALLCVLVGMGTEATSAGDPVVPAVNKDFTIVDCGTPIRVLKLYAGTLYKHPETGQLHLLLEFGNNNGYRIGEQEWEDVWHRLVDVELESGQMRQTNGSDGVTSLHFLHPNGPIYLFEGKTHPASLGQYDPRAGQYRRIGALGDSPYKVVLAPSGRVYVGEVNGGVSVYDPAVGTLTHWDMPAGRKIHWGVYTMEVEEPWIYCGMTNQGKWFLTAIDTRTGKATSYFDVESGQPAAKAGGSSVTRTTAGNLFFGPYPLKDGQPQMDSQGNPVKLNPPDKSPPLEGNRSWPNMWKVAGYAGSRSKEAEEQLGIEFDLNDVEPNNWNDAVATVRWRHKGERPWRTVQIKGLETVGMSTECLGVAPDGKLIGVAAFYGSVFRFDPLTGTSERLGLAPGSVYQILPTAGHTYFCGYVSFLADYDHSQPYLVHKDGTPGTNPKNFSTGVKWTHCMTQGPDGRIYLGGYDGRHRTGGGFSIFDPKTQTMKNLREPWFVYQGVRCLCLIHGGKTLAIATRPVGQNVPDPKGRIFLFDLATQEIVREVVLEELPTNPDQIFVAGERAVIGVSRATEPSQDGAGLAGRERDVTLVYGLDADSGKVLFQKRYPGRALTGLCRYDHTDVVRGPDGCGWLFVDQALCRILPDGTLETVRPQLDYRGKMLWHGKTLYIWNGGRVYSRLFANVVRIADLFDAVPNNSAN